jgi:hypothetical protein
LSTYLLHIEPAFHHAAHYCGFTEERTVTHRVNQHLSGGSKASPLIVAALMAGHTVTLARAWEGDAFDRAFERRLKNLGGRARTKRCPVCEARRRNGGAAK